MHAARASLSSGPGPLRLALGLALGAGLCAPADALARRRDSADCTVEDAKLDTLNLRFSRLKVIWGELDEQRFVAELTALRDQIPCLGERLGPNEAAELHMWMAFEAFVSGAPDADLRAEGEFRASLAAKPGFALPTVLLTEGHPLRARYEAALAAPAPTRAALDLQGLYYFVDGRQSGDRPIDAPTIVQVVDSTGAIVLSAWLETGEELPNLSRFRARGPEPSADLSAEAPAPPPASSGSAPSQRPSLELGFNVGSSTGAHVGLRAPGWNRDGGAGLDEVGLDVGLWQSFDPDFSDYFRQGFVVLSVYVDVTMIEAWQLRAQVCGGGSYLASVNVAGAAVLGVQWDPPDQAVEVTVGAGAGRISSNLMWVPSLSLGWSF